MGVTSGLGRGVFRWAKILTSVTPIFSIFEGRLQIQGPKGFGGWGAYSAFAVQNLGIDSPLLFPSMFPTSVFSGSIWYDVRGVWTFHVGLKFGHELAPLSMVLI